MELLTANDLCCSYGTKSVLHDISFSISSGTITGLLVRPVLEKQRLSIS